MSKNGRFLSMILRHKPHEIGLELDKNAWANVDELLARLNKAGRAMTRTELEEVVSTSDKKRFTLSPDGMRIRAAQGHSFPVDLSLEAQTPPATLFHGTARKNLDSIFATGLEPRGRDQVHLSIDVETATRVGARHGKPVVLLVSSHRMYQDGFLFYQADNGVWLTDKVPVGYVSFGSADNAS
ncbi:RNA 2'-phosphotransferase [Tropicibacter sp. Alg240-R139]|uniref:RNA 2'-phosphotransferase n=1 Tax=Tropicibacter sp. Alg240-R139 TaxID=2305991 RepID=UPI0013E008F4|nr:RNA 2'-phosphotransferase [Tropicibacter sp. Alg240-R139]